MGSRYRVANYRALAAGGRKVHVLAFDYRGFGRSTGSPSASGFILDALAVVEWAMCVARVPPERIMIFGQSLETAVAVAVSERLRSSVPPNRTRGYNPRRPVCGLRDVGVYISHRGDNPYSLTTNQNSGAAHILSKLNTRYMVSQRPNCATYSRK